MLTRNQAVALLICSLTLSGCTSVEEAVYVETQDIASEEMPKAEAPNKDSDDEDYQEIIDRIKESEALEEELRLNNRTENPQEQGNPVQEPKPEGGEGYHESETSKPQEPETSKPQEPENESVPTPASIAYAQVVMLYDDSYEGSVNVIAHEDVAKETVTKVSDSLKTAVSMWDEVVGVITDFEIILFNPDNAAWADQIRTSNGDIVPSGTLVNDNCSHIYILERITYACVNPQNMWYLAPGMIHEYFHGVQYEMGINRSSLNLPIWLLEGSAGYIGDTYAFSAKQLHDRNFLDQDLDFYNKFGVTNVASFVRAYDDQKIISVYKRLEAYSDQNALSIMNGYHPYAFGGVAAEYILYEYGLDALMNFFHSVGSGMHWKTAFSNEFVSLDTFYLNLVEYMRSY